MAVLGSTASGRCGPRLAGRCRLVALLPWGPAELVLTPDVLADTMAQQVETSKEQSHDNLHFSPFYILLTVWDSILLPCLLIGVRQLNIVII